MKILLTGANGYIGKRLLPVLLEEGHDVVCCVRDKERFNPALNNGQIEIVEVDFLKEEQLENLPTDIDAAYYLIHSMSSSIDDFSPLEELSAKNFNRYLRLSSAKQVIYLGGIDNNPKLSRHLESRKNVESILKDSNVPLTALKAGIVVGSGSASFEIIRDLVEKLPLMITPKWLNTKCQPIAIRNVIQYLTRVLGNPACYYHSFEIGGSEVLTYKEMLLQYAEVRKLRRLIITLPVMTPKLSSYWLYFITSTSYKLAVNLVNSMKVDVVCKENDIRDIIPIQLLTYKESISLAFGVIEQNLIISSWKDALVSSSSRQNLHKFINVPQHGIFNDQKRFRLRVSQQEALSNIWKIGGENGWFYGSFLWKIRGYLDKMVGGIGLRRGRTHPTELNPGDALDFWRVIVANKDEKRLLLYAEMKLPGEAWLEFRIKKNADAEWLEQSATFRPSGLAGRIYWYLLAPFHYFIFKGMGKRIASRKSGG